MFTLGICRRRWSASPNLLAAFISGGLRACGIILYASAHFTGRGLLNFDAELQLVRVS